MSMHIEFSKDGWGDWYERLLANALPFTVLTAVAVFIGGLVQIIPTVMVNTAAEHRGRAADSLHAARTRRPRHLHPRRLLQLPLAA